MLDAKIRTLLALASAGSFTRAAQRLGVTQPAVSNHIRLLEQEYGVKIFKSNKKELVFSPEGKVLLKYARQLQAVCQSAEQALEDSKRRLEHLSIGITQTVGENLMPHVIAIYCAENPDTHIRVYTDTINKLYNKRLSLIHI